LPLNSLVVVSARARQRQSRELLIKTLIRPSMRHSPPLAPSQALILGLKRISADRVGLKSWENPVNASA
jgi:hypothetical protein